MLIHCEEAVPDSVSLPLTDELIVDRLTNSGCHPLEFCYENRTWTLFQYSFHPNEGSGDCTVGKLVWPTTVRGLTDAMRSFLRGRGLSFADDGERWAWAVRHRWPCLAKLGSVTPGRPEPPDQTAPPPGDLASQLTLGGRCRLVHCFLVNRLIVAWDPDRAAFAFPTIPDHPSAEQARASVAAATFQVADHPGVDPRTSFVEPLVSHAAALGWPNHAALEERARRWATQRWG